MYFTPSPPYAYGEEGRMAGDYFIGFFEFLEDFFERGNEDWDA
jgi:hypothetical protein